MPRLLITALLLAIMTMSGCRRQINRHVKAAVAKAFDQKTQTDMARAFESKPSSTRRARTVSEISLRRKANETEIKLGVVGIHTTDGAKILGNENSHWVLGRDACIRLARLEAAEQIKKSQSVGNLQLGIERSHKLEKIITLQRRRVENEISADALVAIYSLACEIAKRQVLLKSFDELESLEQMIHKLAAKGLPVDEHETDMELLRHKLQAQAIEIKIREQLLNQQLQAIFRSLPNGSIWPDVSLVISHVERSEQSAIKTAFSYRAEMDEDYQTMAADITADWHPIEIVKRDVGETIAAEVVAARNELASRYQLALNTKLRVQSEQSRHEQLERQNDVFENADFELATSRIKLNQTRISLAESIRDYFLTKIQLQRHQGIARRTTNE